MTKADLIKLIERTTAQIKHATIPEVLSVKISELQYYVEQLSKLNK